MENHLSGHPEERPYPLELPLVNVNLNMKVLISTPGKSPPFFTGHISGVKAIQ